MTRSTLWLFGAGVLLFNLWLIGNFNISGFPVLLLTFGFAAGYEFLVVRPMTAPPAAETQKDDGES